MLCTTRSVSKAVVRVCLLALLACIVAPLSCVAQQRVETTDETNSKIREMAKNSGSIGISGPEYKIGSGDVLSIEVFDVPQLTRDVSVSQNGYIALPLLPVRVLAKGLTGPQLEEKIAELLKANQLITNAQVTVSVRQQNSHPIMVIGSVHNPQVIEATRPMSLVEVLSACGGIGDDAGETVIITRDPLAEVSANGGGDGKDDLPMATPQTTTVNLLSLLNSSNSKSNVILTGGETVSVPKAGIFYVIGAVNHPGGFVLSNNSNEMTTLMALALAAGTLSTAKQSQAVIIRKDATTGKNNEIPIDLQKILTRKSQDTALMANDILFVPDSSGKKALRTIGQVAVTVTTGVAIARVIP